MTTGFWTGAGNGVVSAISGLAGYGLNHIASNTNTTRASKEAKILMKIQDQYQRAFTHDQYGIMRKGLEDAGYNPLLALGSSTSYSQPSASGINSDSDSGQQAVQSAIDAMRVRNENKLAKSQVKVNDSQSDLNTQLTYKALADEIYSRSNSAVASATEQKILNDIRWDNEINKETIKQIQANTKFTNERARGFSASSSENKSYGAGAFSVKGSYGSSKSSSKSW